MFYLAIFSTCLFSTPAILPISFTGGSSSRPRRDQRGRSATRKRNFRFVSEGTFEDEYLTRQAEEEAAQAKAAKKAARRQARAPQVNFETMSSVEYCALRQLDWYAEARDEELEDSRFWCLNQKLIYEQVYRIMSQRVCYMHVLDHTHLRKKSEYFFVMLCRL
jgi:hypothetical protein